MLMVSENESGSAWVLLLAIAGLLGVALVGFGVMGQRLLDATRAQTAADSAALAFVVAGEPGARLVLDALDAELVDMQVDGRRAEVVVRVGEVLSVAAAAADGPSVGTGERSGLAPAMLAALARADELLGFHVPVVSGLRTHADQLRLWNNRDQNPYPVARPGTSRHERGLAVDIPLSVVEALRSVAISSGLCHPLPESDPVHFIVCPARR